MAGEPLPPGALPGARERALLLIADLWARGLTADTLAAWRSVPHLGVDLSVDVDLDEAAAAHVRLTQVELFPYESVFIDDGGLLGGDVAAAVKARRARAGVGDPVELEADHLAEELRLLAFLSGAEGDALRDGVDATSVRVHQQQILDQHLLRWLPAFTLAVEGLELTGVEALYTESVRLARALAVAWRQALPGQARPWALPELLPGLLDDEKTGLGRIARRLCTPALAGIFLSHTAIRGLGARDALPGGFGRRWQVLESVISAAAHYDAVPAVLAALDAELVRHAAAYTTVAEVLPEAVGPWLLRVAESRALVAEMGARARA